MAKNKKVILFFLLIVSGVSRFAAPSVLQTDMGNDAGSFVEKGIGDLLENFLEAEVDTPDDPYIKYNIANCLYKLRKYKDAARYYDSVNKITTDISLLEKSCYNLGNAYFHEGKLFKAVVAYEKALKIDSNDADAAYNLDITKKKIELMSRKKINIGEKNSEQNREKQDNANNDSGLSENKKDASADKEETAGADKRTEDGEDRSNAPLKPVVSMSKTEADAFLESIGDDKKKVLSRQVQSMFPLIPPKTDKDW